MPPLVSVVLPTYNRGAYIAEAVNSALRQTYQPVEVIVVDDGSTDDTTQVMAPIVRDGAGRVTYVRKNAGVSAARNAAMALARGEMLALLDSDDRWLPDKLERQMPLFDDPAVGLVHGGIRCFDNATGATLSEYFPGDRIDVHDLLGHKYLGTQTLVFRAVLAKEIGDFDLALPPAEDWDYTIRLAARCQVRGVAATVAEIRIHGSMLSGNKERLANVSLAVLDKHAHLHANCRLCAKAIRQSRKEFWKMRYRELNRQARVAAGQGQWLGSLKLSLRAFQDDPTALLRLPMKAAGKAIGRFRR